MILGCQYAEMAPSFSRMFTLSMVTYLLPSLDSGCTPRRQHTSISRTGKDLVQGDALDAGMERLKLRHHDRQRPQDHLGLIDEQGGVGAPAMVAVGLLIEKAALQVQQLVVHVGFGEQHVEAEQPQVVEAEVDHGRLPAGALELGA